MGTPASGPLSWHQRPIPNRQFAPQFADVGVNLRLCDKVRMLGRCLAIAVVSVCLPTCRAAFAPTTAVCSYEVQHSFPHDPAAFTQGLLFADGRLFESTGLVGASTIRRVRLDDGRVLQSTSVPKPHFGEGMTQWKDELVSLTWKSGKGFRWNAKSLRQKGEFSYAGEGWGLTHNKKQLILSDGTDTLRFLNPVSMKVERTLHVTANGKPVRNLNELEWVKGEVYANVWMTDQIVRIDPISGAINSVIDLGGLRELAEASGADAVANGIAYDEKSSRLFVTGKNWSKVFQIGVRGC